MEDKIEDTELLRRYAVEKSEQAFAELVRRHLSLVYSVALRQVAGDVHLAEDVTQQVFTALARKAAVLADRPALSGWLYRGAHFAASDAVRVERRRRAREQETHAMNLISTDSDPPTDWDKVRPTLDAAIAELDERDRDAVALRFFDGRSFADIGTKLRLTENAARMRVERALDKLHAQLGRRGVTSTTAALGLTLAHQAAVAAPAGLAGSVTGSALAGGTGAWATIMSIGKIQIGIASALAVAGTAVFLGQARMTENLRVELANLRRQNQSLEISEKEAGRTGIASAARAAQARIAEMTRLEEQRAGLRTRLLVAQGLQPESAGKSGVPFTGRVFELGEVDQQPKPSYQPPAVYPFELRKGGFSGEAMVDFIVDAEGHVRNATAVKATQPAFGPAAVEALSKWQFDPAVKGGKAVPLHLQISLEFTLNNTEKKPAANEADAGFGAKPLVVNPLIWF